jgi:alkanesulfonate monooxygenase SsuD/methylene tetrahydromethanopterin reductase-like flavin-dependent oxidoreductase (luciferase family)
VTKSSLHYWTYLAKLLDQNGFNALFLGKSHAKNQFTEIAKYYLADNFSSHDVYGGSHAAAIRAGSQWPLYDPFVVRTLLVNFNEMRLTAELGNFRNGGCDR